MSYLFPEGQNNGENAKPEQEQFMPLVVKELNKQCTFQSIILNSDNYTRLILCRCRKQFCWFGNRKFVSFFLKETKR